MDAKLLLSVLDDMFDSVSLELNSSESIFVAVGYVLADNTGLYSFIF